MGLFKNIKLIRNKYALNEDKKKIINRKVKKMRKLICIGFGNIPRYINGKLMPYETKEIDEEIINLTNKKKPKMLFISLASYHPKEYFDGIYKIYSKLGCIVQHFDINKSYDELEKDIMSSDIIYVGAGDTKYLLQQLHNNKIDKLLIKAYEKGIVCVGMSAGTYIWFKYTYNLIKGMNVIDAVCCAHYNEKDDAKKKQFHDVIKEYNLTGYAIENCVALEFIDDEIKIIKSNPKYNAYKISYSDNKFITELIK